MRGNYYKLPPHAVFVDDADNGYRSQRRSIIRRTKFVYRLFGPPGGMLMGGVMTADLYFETLRSFILGNYIATVFCAHALFESALGFEFIMRFGSDDKIVESGLAKMSSVARERGWISGELQLRLDELRKMRVAYFHSHVGLHKRGAMTRYLENKKIIHDQQEHDATEALRTVHLFFSGELRDQDEL